MTWADSIWPFLRGKFARESGEDLGLLESSLFVDALMDLFVEDEMFEEEIVKARRNLRAHLLREMSSSNPGYDSTEHHGRSNDNYGAYSEEPLPYLPPTEQTEDGYIGLAAPLS